ncbi:MAG: hypothetical protein M1825_003961 [Sarcosagium campestre]|nr:MAG: hypothetical protein M1825_003961 [Sarcosagium campestre]
MLPLPTSPPSAYALPASRFPAALSPSAMQTSFKVDEGYSEETRSQTGSDIAAHALSGPGSLSQDSAEVALPAWMASLSERDRCELAYTILRTLRTSSMAAIVERLHPLLHLNPIVFLPPELILHTLSYLPPQSLLNASRISRSWRERALDSSLWKQLYWREGWTADLREVNRFERQALPRESVEAAAERKARMTRAAVDGGVGQQRNKKRLQEDGLFGSAEPSDQKVSFWPSSRDGPSTWKEQHGKVEADESVRPQDSDAAQDPNSGLKMDVDSPTFTMSSQTATGGSDSMDLTGSSPLKALSNADAWEKTRITPPLSSGSGTARKHSAEESDLQIKSRLVVPSKAGERKLNWQHLYKQRRKLEDNWHAGRFTNFQLPHPDYPHEGHSECVYTIQYFGKYLVSGSRDKSLRIWDLDTKRLVRKALFGHNGSVLCLQFDASEEEDIIVSGSSDTNVIIWRFSTGEKIRRLRQAHKESVLNLKFDKRYLITCSKDKTINVWSRSQLDTTDKAFPSGAANKSEAIFPSHVVNLATYERLAAEGRLANGHKPPPLPKYSLLMTLKGHNAAVNAIQVDRDEVVSASGDRTIKVWSLQTGLVQTTIPGHNKGIACVQYDGRRIVSGSSDNTVKIFDCKGTEVSCLQGHEDLVRTVQAGFGDLPGSELDDASEAREIDKRYFEALESGQVSSEPVDRLTRQQRNAGSSDPKNITAYGAGLPPGGGGSKWGRIVSGSYDETIIIWKRDATGRWVVGKRLKQAEAARAAAVQTAASSSPADPSTTPQTSQPGNPLLASLARQQIISSVHFAHPPSAAQPLTAQQQSLIQQITSNPQQTVVQQQHHAQLIQAAMADPVLQTSVNQHYQATHGHPINLAQLQAQLNAIHAQQPGSEPPNPTGAPLPHPQVHQHAHSHATQPHVHSHPHPHPHAHPHVHPHVHVHSHPHPHPHPQAQAPTIAPAQSLPHGSGPAATTGATAATAATTAAPAPAAAAGTTANAVTPAAGTAASAATTTGAGPVVHPAGNATLAPQPQQPGGGGNLRIFKLQFDARRIICCSQDPRIVGWDFSNGDEEIMAASQFFQGLG